MNLKNSQIWFERGKKIMPGGVNSPVRSFYAVGGTPPFIKRAKGPYLWDEDDNFYIDYICSWGAIILGHAHPSIVEAVEEAARSGTSYGCPTAKEVLLAEEIRKFFPSMEKIRLVNSGTEATMSAIRLARAATGRDKIIKFAGCYHGHGDSFLISAGSGATTFGVPSSPGVTKKTASDTLIAPFNDIDAVREIFEANRGEIAAVILEPVPGNMGVIVPKEGFLKGLRELTESEGTILIFDEVMSGFRASPGGAQELFGITPDLTTLGKVIGGGLPIGAYGGREDLMSMIAPEGPVYQAGTLSGNPLAVSAGLAALKELQKPELQSLLSQTASALERGLKRAIEGFPVSLNRVGSMLSLFFQTGPVENYEDAKRSDLEKFSLFFKGMLEKGIFLPPSQFEAFFTTAAHEPEIIERTVETAREVLEEIF